MRANKSFDYQAVLAFLEFAFKLSTSENSYCTSSRNYKRMVYNDGFKFAQVSVDLVSLDINPVLFDNESSIYATFTEDESDSASEEVKHFYLVSFVLYTWYS